MARHVKALRILIPALLASLVAMPAWAGDASSGASQPDTAGAAAGSDQPKKTPKKTGKSSEPEILPWAAGAAAPAGEPSSGKKSGAAGDAATVTAAPGSGACNSLYEAACRETPGCSWLADIRLDSGAEIKAHCVDRPKSSAKTAKKKQKPQPQPQNSKNAEGGDKAAPDVAAKEPVAPADAPAADSQTLLPVVPPAAAKEP